MSPGPDRGRKFGIDDSGDCKVRLIGVKSNDLFKSMDSCVGPACTCVISRFGTFDELEIPESFEDLSFHGVNIGLDLGAVKPGAYVCKF